MAEKFKLDSVSDDDLLRRLSEILKESRRVEVDLIAHIGEVDRRRLYAIEASVSMFSYCTERLHLSEHEAFLRIAVARAARKHPVLLSMLEDGRLHLSAIAKLAPVLTESNRDELLTQAEHKTKKKILELVAKVAPKPDVAATMRKLPTRREPQKTATPTQLPPDEVAMPNATLDAVATCKAAVVEPLSPSRYGVHFTASAELHEKLERLSDLMPGADLASVIEAAVTLKLERLEAKRFGKAKKPRKSLDEADTSPGSRYISAPVKRFVYERDGGQCTYVGKDGRRCTARRDLEYHHHDPHGRGGDRSADNISLRCTTHNQLQAERDFGEGVMDQYRRSGESVSEPSPVYYVPADGCCDLLGLDQVGLAQERLCLAEAPATATSG
ncbi:MAG: hypothetical protein E2P02_02000 [Acidobacteria bacterium]|nr:MAG: hypothetical protein E2P02_02000 [Acidobacteriota bacterium]